MRAAAVATILLVAGSGVGWSKALVRVDLDPGQTIEDIAASGIPVVFQLDGACLVRVCEQDIARLDYAGYRCLLLDHETEGRCYVYASFEPGGDRSRVASFGEVLTEDAGGVVLATDEQGISQLPGLGCELARITLRPLVLTQNMPDPEPVAIPDSLVWELVNRVSADTLEARLRRLIGFFTRWTEHDSCRAAVNWLGQRLLEYGCDTVIYDGYQSGYSPQVVGVRSGRLNPRRVYVVCGHIDDCSQLPRGQYAPGSEDNASGTGCVLECARVTADMDFDYTVWFIGWTGEEQGVVGSASYLQRCRTRGDSIMLGMNFDMISYGPQNQDSIRIVGKRANPPCSTWVEFYRAQADTFTSLKHIRYMVNDQQTSDHYSFWNNGFVCIRGGYNVRTDVYHTTGDTIGPLHYLRCGTNNIPMYTEVVKATVATLAKLAGAHRAVGVADVSVDRVRRPEGPTVVRVAPGGVLYDVTGNRATGVKPGVYFTRTAKAEEAAVGARKVVVAR